MGVNMCKPNPTDSFGVLLNKGTDDAQLRSDKETSKERAPNSVLSLELSPKRASGNEGEQGVEGDTGTLSGAESLNVVDSFLSEKKNHFDRQLPLFVNAKKFKHLSRKSTRERILHRNSTWSPDYEELHSWERLHQELAHVGGEGSSILAHSALLGEGQNKTQNKAWRRRGQGQRVRSLRCGVDYSVASVSQNVSVRQESITSDCFSIADSVTNNSSMSESHFVRTLRSGIDSARTLENAKATLRKHMNLPVMPSLRSGEISSRSSVGIYPPSENDFSLIKGTNTFGAFSGDLAQSPIPTQSMDGICRRESSRRTSVYEPPLVKPVVLNRTASLHSARKTKKDASRRRNNLSFDRVSFMEIMEKSTNFNPGGGFVGGVEDVSNRTPQSRSLCKMGRRSLCGVVEPNTSFHQGTNFLMTNEFVDSEGLLNSGERDNQEYYNNVDRNTASNTNTATTNTNTGWVAIGSEAGIGTDDWYARLRRRCDLEDTSETFPPPARKGLSCGDHGNADMD